MTTFGELLKSDREKLRLSQEALAKMLNVSQQAVANWEAGTSHPKRDRRVQLLQILGPNSELAKNPPRYDFVPAQVHKVSQPDPILRYGPTNPTEMPPSPDPQQSADTRARFEEARKRAELIVERQHRERDEFMAHLPRELHDYCEGVISVGAATRRLDYLSPKRGVEIKRAPRNRFMSWVSSTPALVNLAVARGIADQGLRPPRNYSLILVTDGQALLGNNMQKLMFDAGVLGISVYQVESYGQAAELIAELETEGEDVADVTGEDMMDIDDQPEA